MSAATEAEVIFEGARRRSRSGSRSGQFFARLAGEGRGAHSEGLEAHGGRVGTRRQTTELGSERLPADSVELRSSDFAYQLPFDGGTGTSGSCTRSRGGA